MIYKQTLGDLRLRQLVDEFPNISGFTYRIGRHGVGDDAYYRLYESYYDEEGNVLFWGEASPHGETATL